MSAGSAWAARAARRLAGGPVLAVRFLTRLPVPLPAGQAPDLGPATGWFPLAGAVVGAVAAAAQELLALVLPAPVAAAGAVAAAMLVTGALHLDGLMDTADGLGGARGERERALRIMRDSRVGAAGAVTGAVALLVRYSLYAAVAAQSPLHRAGLIVAAAATGRWGMVVAAAGRRPAREGLGSLFHAGLTPLRVAGAGVLGAAVALAGGGVARGLIAFGAASATAAALGSWLGRRLGGYTGDTLGAAGEVAELVALACLVARWPPGG